MSAISSPPSAALRPARRWPRWLAALLVIPLALGIWAFGVSGRSHPPDPTAPAASEPDDGPNHTSVKFPRERWESSGVRTEPAASTPLSDFVWRTGRVVVNDDRVAHISPPVEGIIREVRVRLGQDVTAGQVLAVLDSEKVSQAKLDLVTARAALTAERERERWARLTADNTDALVSAVAAGKTVAEIDAAFKDRPVGDRRQLLMAAYTGRTQAKAQLESTRVSAGAVSGIIRQRAEADHDAAAATLQAMLEEFKFQSRQQARMAELKLRESEAVFDVARTRLLTLGYTPKQVAEMDPVKEGATASFYEVKSPFAGTIVDKHAVLSERVNAQFQMFQLADLSTVWIQADAFEADLPLLRGLRGRKPGGRQLQFRAPSAGIPESPADMFYAGDIMDKASRAVTVTASAPNPEFALKPGMYVEVGLPRGGDAPVVHVPARAIQRYQGKAFVFVLTGEEEFRRVDVELGPEAGDRVEVKAGLKPGDQVAVGGGFVLKSELYRSQLAGD
ncbi:MAG: efflux RND transporter periplasmic adaptor subunit [Gemmataceae bacterium]